jgi:hypothetical protein
MICKFWIDLGGVFDRNVFFWIVSSQILRQMGFVIEKNSECLVINVYIYIRLRLRSQIIYWNSFVTLKL